MNAAKDFRDFILRGNVVDLAVGVVVGAAFGTVVKAMVADLITPLVGIPGHFNFSDLTFAVNGSRFLVGDFLNSVISFLLVSVVVFFFVVRPVNWLMALRKTEPPTETATRECPACLSKVPAQASRCAFCTGDLVAI